MKGSAFGGQSTLGLECCALHSVGLKCVFRQSLTAAPLSLRSQKLLHSCHHKQAKAHALQGFFVQGYVSPLLPKPKPYLVAGECLAKHGPKGCTVWQTTHRQLRHFGWPLRIIHFIPAASPPPPLSQTHSKHKHMRLIIKPSLSLTTTDESNA